MELPHNDMIHIFQNIQKIFLQLKNKNIFLTGGTGFFGIWFIESFIYSNQILKLNSKMTILTRNKEKFLKKFSYLKNIEEINFIEGDIRSFRFPTENYDFIIHAATHVSTNPSAEDAADIISIIIDGTRHILNFAKKCGAKKFLLTSSGAAYGKQLHSTTHINEDSNSAPSTMNPCSAYGEAKRISELLCSIAASHSALEVKIARCFAFVGPHLPLDSHYAIGNFIYDAINSKNILIQGNGSPLRSYLYASDLMIWLWTLLFNGKSSQIYNIGSEHAISIAELAHLIAKMSGNISNVIIKKPYADGDPIERYIPSTKRAENDLGLKQLISLEKALKRTINWYKTKKL